MAAEAEMKPEDVKEESNSIEEKILELVTEFPQGVSDKVRSIFNCSFDFFVRLIIFQVLFANMPTIDPKARAQVINKLLVGEKIDLFKGTDGLVYKKRVPSQASNIAGDQEEKMVFRIIEETGNKGIWIRDIR